MANEASNLYVESSRKAVFDLLVKALSTETNRARNIDAFLLAVAYGYKLGRRQPLQRKDSYIKTSQVAEHPAAKALLASVGLDVRQGSEPPSINECYAVSEEFANAGAEALQAKLSDFDVFRHWLNSEVLSAADGVGHDWPFEQEAEESGQ